MVSLSVTAIVPKVQYNPRKFVQDMQRRAANTRRQIQRDFEKTTKNWKEEVDFKVSQKKQGDRYTFTAFTDNTIYGYVNDGTEPHLIVAKNAPFLSFRVGGTAKTTVGKLKSGKGKRGNQFVQKKQVQHPGTKARKFDEIIAERFKERWVKESNEALRMFLQTSTRPAGRR